MFRCSLCGHLTAPRTKAVHVTLETRPRSYPFRAKANVVRRPDRCGKVREYRVDDPGGGGTEIVREVLTCPPCARNGTR